MNSCSCQAINISDLPGAPEAPARILPGQESALSNIFWLSAGIHHLVYRNYKTTPNEWLIVMIGTTPIEIPLNSPDGTITFKTDIAFEAMMYIHCSSKNCDSVIYIL